MRPTRGQALAMTGPGSRDTGPGHSVLLREECARENPQGRLEPVKPTEDDTYGKAFAFVSLDSGQEPGALGCIPAAAGAQNLTSALRKPPGHAGGACEQNPGDLYPFTSQDDQRMQPGGAGSSCRSTEFNTQSRQPRTLPSPGPSPQPTHLISPIFRSPPPTGQFPISLDGLWASLAPLGTGSVKSARLGLDPRVSPWGRGRA